MKFVVDRRPSRVVLTDERLWNFAETVAATAATEMTRGGIGDDDDVVIDDKQHKRSKRRISDAQDHNVEFSTAETTIVSPAVDVSEKGSKPGPQLDRDRKTKKRRKRDHEEQMTEIVEKVTEDSGCDAVTDASQVRKKNKLSVDAASPRTRVDPLIENRSEDSAVVLRNESCESVGLAHHRRKKDGKDRPISSVGVTEENKAGELRLSAADHGKKQKSESPAKSPVTETASMSPSGGQKSRQKKRSKLSKEVHSSPSHTDGKDPSVELALTSDVAEETVSVAVGGTDSVEAPKLPNRMTSECGKETVDVEKSPGVEGTKSSVLLQFVMQDDDDNTSTVTTGCDNIPDNTRIKVPSTPTRGVSDKLAVSPGKSSQVTVASGETGNLVKACSSRSDFDPSVILESPVVKKSPTKTARRVDIDVEDLLSPTDGSAACQLPASASDILVCLTNSVRIEVNPFCTN